MKILEGTIHANPGGALDCALVVGVECDGETIKGRRTNRSGSVRVQKKDLTYQETSETQRSFAEPLACQVNASGLSGQVGAARRGIDTERCADSWSASSPPVVRRFNQEVRSDSDIQAYPV